jgi:hypothetical protein
MAFGPAVTVFNHKAPGCPDCAPTWSLVGAGHQVHINRFEWQRSDKKKQLDTKE